MIVFLFAVAVYAQLPDNYVRGPEEIVSVGTMRFFVFSSFFSSRFSSSSGELQKCPLADGFDLPIGAPDARGRRTLAAAARSYRDANPFLSRTSRGLHLGEDWNGRGGGNTDLGDAVFAAAAGVVVAAVDIDERAGVFRDKAWGKIVRIVHKYRDSQGNERFVESLYAHLQRFDVSEGQIVQRGDQIGTIGTADGSYLAHLHFELRRSINIRYRSGYTQSANEAREMGYLNPTEWIAEHVNLSTDAPRERSSALPVERPPSVVEPRSHQPSRGQSPREQWFGLQRDGAGSLDQACQKRQYHGVQSVTVEMDGIRIELFRDRETPQQLALRLSACLDYPQDKYERLAALLQEAARREFR